MASSQVADSQFSAEGQGHAFELRKPLAKVTARKCLVCSESIFDHARREVHVHGVLHRRTRGTEYAHLTSSPETSIKILS